MGFTDAIRKCLRDWITFSGRAPRSEFWWFYLFFALYAVVAALIIGFLASIGSETLVVVVGIVLGIGGAWIYIAQISATVRRLHDRNLSGWWLGGFVILNVVQGGLDAGAGESSALALILALLVFIGGITLLVVNIMRGTQGPNRYGPDPLNPIDADVFR